VNGTLWSVMNQHGDLSNDEPECYMTANTGAQNGMLTETARAQTVNCGDGTGTASYTSGAVQMKSFNFTYGTVDVRARMAGGRGTWPAIWLLGADCQHPTWLSSNCPWPDPGSDEIDISEIIGGDLTTVHQTLISGDARQTCSPSTSDVSTSWHTYTLDWEPGRLTFKIDGSASCTMTDSSVPSHPMFLIIDTAVGGNGGGAVENSTLPQTTSVDYVRIRTP